ncbi:MAG TPA: hypothetical protein VG860_07210 [Terriglobia bacterium]|jgi:hypothetical protein|nr:hypothetical protein [Terriglobia bacterium]
MNSIRVPGFTAQKSLAVERDRDFTATRRHSPGVFANNLNGSGLVQPADENEPGGPGNVPSGYGRDCQLVPVTVCDGSHCWTEYQWACTYYPLPRSAAAAW